MPPRPAASRRTRAAAARTRATTPASPKSGSLARCSRAGRTCARRIIAAATARPRVIRSRWTPRRAMSVSAASFVGGRVAMSDANPQALGLLSKLVIAFAIVLIAAGVYWHGFTERLRGTHVAQSDRSPEWADVVSLYSAAVDGRDPRDPRGPQGCADRPLALFCWAILREPQEAHRTSERRAESRPPGSSCSGSRWT